MLHRAVIDTPNERSSHTVPTPRGGGLAVVVAALCALVAGGTAVAVAVPLLLFGAIGLAEDVRGVPIRTRFALQFAAGAVSAVALTGRPLAVVGLAIWLTGYANAFNFMDGVNGISAVHAVVAGLVYSVLGAVASVPLLASGGVCVALAA